MVKNKAKESELFSPGEMKGGVKKRDYFLDESISAYLMYMKRSSLLDDDSCLKLDSADVYNDSILYGYWFKPHG